MSNYLRSLPNPQPFHLGQIAYADGKPIDANPYKPGFATVAEYPGNHANWRAGWLLAKGWAEHEKAPRR